MRQTGQIEHGADEKVRGTGIKIPAIWKRNPSQETKRDAERRAASATNQAKAKSGNYSSHTGFPKVLSRLRPTVE